VNADIGVFTSGTENESFLFQLGGERKSTVIRRKSSPDFPELDRTLQRTSNDGGLEVVRYQAARSHPRGLEYVFTQLLQGRFLIQIRRTIWPPARRRNPYSVTSVQANIGRPERAR